MTRKEGGMMLHDLSTDELLAKLEEMGDGILDCTDIFQELQSRHYEFTPETMPQGTFCFTKMLKA